MPTSAPDEGRASRRTRIPRPNAGLLVAVALVVTLVSTAVLALGAGQVLVFANLIALYLAMTAFGGTLRSDLRDLRGTSIALLIGVALPAFCSSWSLLVSGAIVIASVAALSLIPALGQRYVSVEQGIGLAILYAFGYQSTRLISAEEIVAGTAAAFLVVVLIRVLVGAVDPEGALRSALATAVSSPSSRNAERAIVLWTRGPARTWMKQALAGALLFVTSRDALAREADAQPVLERLDRAASAVAAGVSARKAPARTPETLHELEASLSGGSAAAVAALDALGRIDLPSRERDTTRDPQAGRARRLYARTALAGALSPASPRSRHALRLLAAMTITVPVAVLLLPPAFGVSLLMSVYGFLQLSWEGTLQQVKRRLLGVLVGGILGGMTSAMLPTSSLTILGILALIVGFAYATSSITILMGCIVFGLTIALAPTLDLRPVEYALGYIATVALGAVIAAVLAFITVPLHSTESARATTAHAATTTARLLDAVATETSPTDGARALVFAYRANHRVLPRRDRHRSSSPSSAEIDRDHDGLADLHLVAFLLLAGILPRTYEARNACRNAAKALRPAEMPSAPAASAAVAEDHAHLAASIVTAAIDGDRRT